MKLFKMLKDKCLIWLMLDEMVQKRLGQGCIFHEIILHNILFGENFMS